MAHERTFCAKNQGLGELRPNEQTRWQVVKVSTIVSYSKKLIAEKSQLLKHQWKLSSFAEQKRKSKPIKCR